MKMYSQHTHSHDLHNTIYLHHSFYNAVSRDISFWHTLSISANDCFLTAVVYLHGERCEVKLQAQTWNLKLCKVKQCRYYFLVVFEKKILNLKSLLTDQDTINVGTNIQNGNRLRLHSFRVFASYRSIKWMEPLPLPLERKLVNR